MMKCPKTDGLENLLDKINLVLDHDMRGASATASGNINSWTLQLNDLNKETEYQDNKYNRELPFILRLLGLYSATTLTFSILGVIRYYLEDYKSTSLMILCGLTIFSVIIYLILPTVVSYLGNVMLVYIMIIIFTNIIMSINSNPLIPIGFYFVLVLMTGLSQTPIHVTICLLVASTLIDNMFIMLSERASNYSFHMMAKFLQSILLCIYVYYQELEKKTKFQSGHKLVRNYLKLGLIYNVLVPALVRDKILSGNKNFSNEEGEVTIVFIDIHKFDNIVNTYKGDELLALLDKVYNAFD